MAADALSLFQVALSRGVFVLPSQGASTGIGAWLPGSFSVLIT
jgi:hypothetical protein